jgi:hypothetical protein
MANLTLVNRISIVEDGNATNNPQKRIPDWTQNIQGMSVNNPLSAEYAIQPSQSLSIFNGSYTTSIGAIPISVSLNPFANGTYRFTGTSALGLRVDRAIDFTGTTLVLTVNNNSLATLAITAGAATFASAQVGDIIILPGIITGDTVPSTFFSAINQGFWQIIGIPTTTTVSMVRAYSQPFQGAAQTVTAVPTGLVSVFSSTGVQIGDTVSITGGFSPVTQGDYVLSQVTSKWFEFATQSPIPLETATPSSSQMIFYKTLKKFVYVQADQNCVIRCNADVTDNVSVNPTYTPNGNVGIFFKMGYTYSLTVVNKSSLNTLRVVVITAE